MDTEIYILYGTFFVVIFLGLLFSLAKGLGDFANFPKTKKKNDDPARASTDHDKVRKRGKVSGRNKRWEEALKEENAELNIQVELGIKRPNNNSNKKPSLERMLKKRRG